MKIALIGYGKMGKTIEAIALARGHQIVSIIDLDNQAEMQAAPFQSADVVIEFSTPAAAFQNYMTCLDVHLPVVAGTTGWLDKLDIIKARCENEQATFFYSSNYSIGVNLFFALNRQLAKLMNAFPTYEVSLTETHHIHKLDAPSGTAITLAEGIEENIDRKEGWTLEKDPTGRAIAITALREDEVPGIHEVIYDAEEDTISIKHSAKSRRGFALGAVIAAEFTQGKRGFLTMDHLLHLRSEEAK